MNESENVLRTPFEIRLLRHLIIDLKCSKEWANVVVDNIWKLKSPAIKRIPPTILCTSNEYAENEFVNWLYRAIDEMDGCMCEMTDDDVDRIEKVLDNGYVEEFDQFEENALPEVVWFASLKILADKYGIKGFDIYDVTLKEAFKGVEFHDIHGGYGVYLINPREFCLDENEQEAFAKLLSFKDAVPEALLLPDTDIEVSDALHSLPLNEYSPAILVAAMIDSDREFGDGGFDGCRGFYLSGYGETIGKIDEDIKVQKQALQDKIAEWKVAHKSDSDGKIEFIDGGNYRPGNFTITLDDKSSFGVESNGRMSNQNFGKRLAANALVGFFEKWWDLKCLTSVADLFCHGNVVGQYPLFSFEEKQLIKYPHRVKSIKFVKGEEIGRPEPE